MSGNDAARDASKQNSSSPSDKDSVYSEITEVSRHPLQQPPVQPVPVPPPATLSDSTDGHWRVAVEPASTPPPTTQQPRIAAGRPASVTKQPDSVYSEITVPFRHNPAQPIQTQLNGAPDSVYSEITVPFRNPPQPPFATVIRAGQMSGAPDSVYSEITVPFRHNPPQPIQTGLHGAPDSVYSEITVSFRNPLGSTSLAQLAGEGEGRVDEVDSAVIPVEMAPPSPCEQCGEVVQGDYRSRRSHVHEKHRPEEKVTLLETQEALRESIKGCFPNAVVQNDLMCNFRGCGQQVTHYKGRVVAELQGFHIQQHHLAVIDPDLVPLRCPVGDCNGWGSARRDYKSLNDHLLHVHKGLESMSETDRTACEQLLDRLQEATEQSLPTFFPHTPKGHLCIGAADKRSRPKATRLDTALPRAQPRSLNSAVPSTGSGGETVVSTEPLATDCQQCGEAVSPAYSSRHEHVLARHMGGRLEGPTVMHQQDTLKMETIACFPDARVCNDLTCNRCGEELKPMAWKVVRELQSWHIQQHHFDAVGDDAKINCPVFGCQRTRYQIPHIYALRLHLVNTHRGVGKLTAAEKEIYERLRERVREATDELLPECFPHTPRGYLDGRTTHKRPAPQDDEPLVNPW